MARLNSMMLLESALRITRRRPSGESEGCTGSAVCNDENGPLGTNWGVPKKRTLQPHGPVVVGQSAGATPPSRMGGGTSSGQRTVYLEDDMPRELEACADEDWAALEGVSAEEDDTKDDAVAVEELCATALLLTTTTEDEDTGPEVATGTLEDCTADDDEVPDDVDDDVNDVAAEELAARLVAACDEDESAVTAGPSATHLPFTHVRPSNTQSTDDWHEKSSLARLYGQPHNPMTARTAEARRALMAPPRTHPAPPQHPRRR